MTGGCCVFLQSLLCQVDDVSSLRPLLCQVDVVPFSVFSTLIDMVHLTSIHLYTAVGGQLSTKLTISHFKLSLRSLDIDLE